MHTRTPISPEFKGRAKQFRSRVKAGDRLFTTMRDRTLDALVERAKRKPSFRRATCLDLLRNWINTTQFGQHPERKATLSFQKDRVRITDYRPGTNEGRWDSWQSEEYEEAV